MTENLFFADADSDFKSSDYVIFGIPHDKTGAHRTGTSQAPESIRRESFNFETYLYDLAVDLVDVRIHDLGNTSIDATSTTVRKILEAKKIPIALGGEHSISPLIISEFKDISVLVFDAHLDFRNEYEGEKNSHACAIRRMSEIVKPDRIIPLGIRSMCKGELADAECVNMCFITAEDVSTQSFEAILDTIDERLKDRIYVSLDMDVFDPAYAPGVGTPEPFGLTPIFVRDVIRHIAQKVVGLDIVEVCPPYDNGNTSTLAAKLVRDFIGAREKP
jgi:agmatinase